MRSLFRALFSTKQPLRGKIILFIDYEVPRFDLFAGSRTNYMYLTLLKELGLRVILLPGDFNGAEPYTSHLSSLGIEVLHGEFYRQNWKDWAASESNNIDFVLINKPDPALQFLDYFAAHSRASILYQIHDLHHVRLLRKYDLLKSEDVLSEANRYREVEFGIIRKCDLVLTYSRFEKVLIQKEIPGKKVFQVPIFFYKDTSDHHIDFQSRSGLLFVGGFAHAPNADALNWFVEGVFPRIVSEIPDIVLHVAGAYVTDEIRSLQSERIKILGHVSDDELQQLYSQSKLSVVPIRYGAGVKGKIVEAMNYGVPVVSTGIGIEGLDEVGDLIHPQDDEAGFAAEVVRLYKNDAMLSRISSESRRYIRAHFSFATAQKLMSSILTGLNSEIRKGSV